MSTYPIYYMHVARISEMDFFPFDERRVLKELYT